MAVMRDVMVKIRGLRRSVSLSRRCGPARAALILPVTQRAGGGCAGVGTPRSHRHSHHADRFGFVVRFTDSRGAFAERTFSITIS